MDTRRFPAKFWVGAAAGVGLGIFGTAWFLEQWGNDLPMPNYEVIILLKILGWVLMIAGVSVAVYLGRRGAPKA